jgi:glycosyltransferase involved in cell wall biosynthesis
MNSKSIDFVLLIPCYNNISGLSASLKSISYPVAKFEVLIVDDGSTTPITKNELQVQDSGMVIQIIRLDNNKGIVQALNAGLAVLRSRTDFNYIARLDAGDTCNELRFHKQVDFLNQHPEIALLASWAWFQSADSNSGYDYITQTAHQDISRQMHYKCCFIHPSVMFRKEVLDTIGAYPTSYPHAEDYAFFWMILKNYKAAVIPENLVNITFSNKNVSSENYKKQLGSRKKIVKEFGDSCMHKLVGIGMLNFKLRMPRSLIQFLKTK